MKFKNKKTGDIKDWNFSNWYQAMLNPKNKEKYECNLSDFIDRVVKFREEWEDAEGINVPKVKEALEYLGRAEVILSDMNYRADVVNQLDEVVKNLEDYII